MITVPGSCLEKKYIYVYINIYIKGAMRDLWNEGDSVQKGTEGKSKREAGGRQQG